MMKSIRSVGRTFLSAGLTLIIVLLSSGVTGAEVKIAAKYRIKNRPPGRCGWCALETLARHHQLTELYELSKDNASRCTAHSLKTALAKTSVSYRIQYPGTMDQEILHYATREGLGAAVGFREPYPGAGGHIVTLVDFTEDSVKVIDPNDQDGRIRRMSLERFLHWWDGLALVLEPHPRNDAGKVVAGTVHGK
jgi:ABC-type bacteriocin/lantibiotic exporter with double-glycine peptidase domain